MRALKFSHRLRIEGKYSYEQITINIKHLKTMHAVWKELFIDVHTVVELMWISAHSPHFYPGRDAISIRFQLKKKFKDPLIIVKFFIMLTATGMERLEVEL